MSGVPSRGEPLGHTIAWWVTETDEVVSGVQLVIATTITGDAEKIRISIHETEYIFGRRDDATGGEASTGAVFPWIAITDYASPL